MNRTTFQRTLFLVAAGFNLVVAIGLATQGDRLFPLLEMPVPRERLTFDLFAGTVLLFGLSYLWIARAPADNRTLIILGAVGKTAAFLTLLAHFFLGDASGRLLILVSADLLFAGLFVVVLVQIRK